MSRLELERNGSQSTIKDVIHQLNVDLEQGLSEQAVKERQEQFGRNELQKAKRRSAWEIFIDQFKNLIVLLLAIAAILSFLFQEWVEGGAIIIAIVLNAVIGFVTEIKAVRSMESLQELSRTHAKVRREGKVKEIQAADLVPGDVVLFEGGDLIPADLRLAKISRLQIDEAPLTGESLPVSKSTDPLDEDKPVAERTNMAFKGTAVTRGSGEGIVVATGMDTELGHISKMTSEAQQEATPLEKRLDQLGRRLIWVTLAIAALVAGSGIIGGKDLFLMVETAIALAVGAVPEGLPIVATVALARGMHRMAKRNALINRLSAVETLGATSVICTDKTGTLTENRMTVRAIELASGRVNISGEALSTKGEFSRDGSAFSPSENKELQQLLEVAVLCNNATFPGSTGSTDGEAKTIGDPMEIALLVAGAKANIHQEQLLNDKPEEREVAFDSETKMMATYHHQGDRVLVAVKGAPEATLTACRSVQTDDSHKQMTDEQRQHWQQMNQDMAAEGLRILAIAYKITDSADAEPYSDLTLLGLVGFVDPPREDAKTAIHACHEAGIRVIMITGDQAITARSVGLAVGLVDEKEVSVAEGKELKHPDDLPKEEHHRLQQVPIFARVSPEQKLNLITIHQEMGAIVAMTGDGVNDAPALKKADIGIAMGQRGTEVAKEAADMVLQDDAFASILAAVAQGRAIFRNIRKFTVYLLSGNVGEIIAVAAASLVNAPLPLLPLQILFINAVNDVFPALALGVGQGSPSQMRQPPRSSKEPVLASQQWWTIAGYGVLIAVVTLGIFAFSLRDLGMSEEQATTISFLTLAFGRLWHVFNMRDNQSPVLRNEITMNPYIWGALLVCSALLLAAVYIPPLASVLGVVNPQWQGWQLIILGSLLPLILGQIGKLILPNFGKLKKRFR